MATIFRRPQLAEQMAQRLLDPGVLDAGLRSGLFLAGPRRIGKTTFLHHDLIPALEARGVVVIYVDLWSNTQVSPTVLLHAAVAEALADLQSPSSRIRERLRRVSSLDLGALSFKFGLKLEQVGAKDGPTLAQAMVDLVDQAKTDVVMIVDEVQQAILTEDGSQMMLALKAARDAVNLRPDTPGHFIFIGTGSHRALIHELTTRRNQAFTGATSVEFPRLGEDYVADLLRRLKAEGVARLPSLATASAAFVTLGNRPEEMLKLLREFMRTLPAEADPDLFLPPLAAVLRSHAADTEIGKVERLGALAMAIFDRIASADGDARGVFSNEAAVEYGKAVGRPVRVEEIQPIVAELVAANVIMRRGHGLYGVCDPFVQQIWRERKALLDDPPPKPPA